MKKWWIWLGILIFISCERDDLCLQNPVVTVNTVFLNANGDKEVVDSLTVLTISGDTLVPLAPVDSVGLVPNPGQTADTLIFKKISGALQAADTVLLQYRPAYQFVSKACGYRMIYKNMQAALRQGSNSWIDSIRLNTNQIDNDTITHLEIYH